MDTRFCGWRSLNYVTDNRRIYKETAVFLFAIASFCQLTLNWFVNSSKKEEGSQQVINQSYFHPDTYLLDTVVNSELSLILQCLLSNPDSRIRRFRYNHLLLFLFIPHYTFKTMTITTAASITTIMSITSHPHYQHFLRQYQRRSRNSLIFLIIHHY